MASPLNNPWISGGLGVGILVYFVVSFTPEAWKSPVRDFFTGELKREAAKEPELKTGSEKLFRAVTKSGQERSATLLMRSTDEKTRLLFREIPKGVKEKPPEPGKVPELPPGSGLLAVWMDGTVQVAMMTDGMVREGEPWGVFTVEKITPASVTLRHESGTRVLQLGEVQAKSETAKLSGAPPETKPAESSAELQLKKIMEMQKFLDPSKLLQGFSH